jgi:hypothetical protein
MSNAFAVRPMVLIYALTDMFHANIFALADMKELYP